MDGVIKVLVHLIVTIILVYSRKMFVLTLVKASTFARTGLKLVAS